MLDLAEARQLIQFAMPRKIEQDLVRDYRVLYECDTLFYRRVWTRLFDFYTMGEMVAEDPLWTVSLPHPDGHGHLDVDVRFLRQIVHEAALDLQPLDASET